MKENNQHVQRTLAGENGKSRREFIRDSALALASAGATGMLTPGKAWGAELKTPAGSGPYPTEGMAGYSETGPLKPMKFQRRALGPKDVAIQIHFCGVCHSDIHTIHGDWGKIQYPQIV